MDLLNTIKGTATNKGKARIWVESSKLAGYGFNRGELVTITMEEDLIRITLDSNGSRKVAGRVRSGKEIGIFDICMTMAEREAIFHGAEKLSVYIKNGEILIKAEKI